jgi:hypothetical protein
MGIEPSPPRHARETRAALLVGTGQYDDARIPALRSPSADVEGLREALRAPDIGGFHDVATLLNPGNAELRKSIAKFFTNRRRGDLLVFYFSGHGLLDRNGQLYLAAQDTDPDVLSATGIAASFVAETMDDCSSKRQIVILDCCYSGAFERGIKSVAAVSDQSARAFAGNGFGRVILTASTPAQRASEGQRVGLVTPRSAFTHFLVEGLGSGRADLDGDGLISIDEIYQFAHDAMVDQSTGQTPTKSERNVQGRLIIAQAGGSRGRAVPNAIATDRRETRPMQGLALPSRRTVLILAAGAFGVAATGAELRRRAALRAAYAEFASSLARYTMNARDYLRIYNEAARAALAAAVAHVQEQKESPSPDDLPKPVAEIRLDRIIPKYNSAIDDLKLSRERYYDAIAQHAWTGSELPATVSRAEALAIDTVHHGNLERLNNVTTQVRELEKCAAKLTCGLDTARKTAYEIGRQLDEVYHGADTGLSDLERIHRELNRSVLGIQG